MHWVLCEDCHRVLLAEHGPVCPECLAKREAEVVEAPPAQQPVMTPTRKPRAVAEPMDDSERVPGCCGK